MRCGWFSISTSIRSRGKDWHRQMSMPLRLSLRQLSVTSNAACPSDMWGTDRVDWSLRRRRVRGIGKGSLDTSQGAGRQAMYRWSMRLHRSTLISMSARLWWSSLVRATGTGARHWVHCNVAV